MEISKTIDETFSVLVIDGDVDLSTSPILRAEIMSSVQKKRPSVAINLAAVAYMDSSGLATLVEALQITRRHGGALALFGLSDRVQRIFELARLHQVFKIHLDELSAVAWIQESNPG